jgi:prephenate dehydrogenase
MARIADTFGVIGLGLMGGSAALRLKQKGAFNRIIGFDVNRQHGLAAKRLGIVDELTTLDQLISSADMILLAIPVNTSLELLPRILNGVSVHTAILDFGSTKEKLCKAVQLHERRGQFVACHPIAGTEHSGPSAAFPGLFQNRVNIVCDAGQSNPSALQQVEDVIGQLGMRNKYMESKDHDRHIAYVSHLSHISSFTLGKTVLEVEKDEKNIFDMAGSGFASTVRLAKSSPQMWAPIFTENAGNVLEVLSAYIDNLNVFKELIEEKNEQELTRIMTETNIIRKVLEGDKLNVTS